jgi:MFS family permease
MNASQQPFRVRSLLSALYLPNLLFTMGQGAVLPILALLALDLGATTATASVVVALRGLGMMLFDLPAGAIVGKLGDRRAMSVASASLSALAMIASVRVALPVFAVLVVLMGCAWAVWTVARLGHVTDLAPPAHRGRAMSTLGGVSRMGLFVGPLLGALSVMRFGLSGPLMLQAVLTGAAAVTLWRTPTPRSVPAPPTSDAPLRLIIKNHRGTFKTAGVVVISLQILRNSREAIIPLWGASIGVSAGQVSLIFGVASFMEMLAFYPVGALMDRKGRKWALAPSMLLLSLGIASIPLSSRFATFVGIAMMIGLANGLSSGTNMTLGSDLAPSVGRSRFLGMWRLISDVGTTSGPLVVAGMTAVASLSAAALTVAGAGILGLATLLFRVPETRPPAVAIHEDHP